MWLALCRWGNALSTKMFVGEDFVLKHIRVKHAEKVEEYKNKVGHHFLTMILLAPPDSSSFCQGIMAVNEPIY